jgi:AbrB family looped-hinge helix DNA binding protein
MVTAIVTSKGQITIPKAVRDALGLHTGDRVEFVAQGRDGAVMRPMTRTVDEVFGRAHKAGRAPRTTEEMNEAIRDRIRQLIRERRT